MAGVRWVAQTKRELQAESVLGRGPSEFRAPRLELGGHLMHVGQDHRTSHRTRGASPYENWIPGRPATNFRALVRNHPYGACGMASFLRSSRARLGLPSSARVPVGGTSCLDRRGRDRRPRHKLYRSARSSRRLQARAPAKEFLMPVPECGRSALMLRALAELPCATWSRRSGPSARLDFEPGRPAQRPSERDRGSRDLSFTCLARELGCWTASRKVCIEHFRCNGE
jgi:hypothetical protein